MTVFVYVNTSKQVGDAEHVKVFANPDAAEKCFEENDPEGLAAGPLTQCFLVLTVVWQVLGSR